MTIEAWIKPDNITANPSYEISRQEGGSISWILSFQNNETILSFVLNTAVGGYSELDVPITATNYTDGNWHHVAAVYNGTNKFLYVDGVLIGTQAKTGNCVNGGGNNHLGRWPLGSEFFDGVILFGYSEIFFQISPVVSELLFEYFQAIQPVFHLVKCEGVYPF